MVILAQLIGALLGFACMLLIVFWFFILPLILLVRVRGVDHRLKLLEGKLESLAPAVEAAPAPRPSAPPPTLPSQPPSAIPMATPEEQPPERTSPLSPPASGFSLETWIGARGLGWLAVLLLLFATAFFLKYAFDNEWIGPTGQVALGLLVGSGLAYGGMRVHQRGRALFGQMLTAAGVVVLYLTTFATFGFYRLLPQEWGFVFLVLLVLESAALALVYEAFGIALMALIGGLLTPLLLHSETDQYVTLFVYLLVLNAGVVVVTVLRPWPVLCTLALLGTQAIFGGWAQINYHPEKLAWALGFQGGLFLLFQGQLLLTHAWRGRWMDVEGLVRLILLAFFFGLSVFALMWTDYREWMSTLAIGFAILYTATAWWLLHRKPDNPPLLLTLITIAMAFIAFSIPLEARAAWIPVGWAVQGLALWWFGLRIRNLPLRLMGLVLLVLAVLRLAFIDTPFTNRELFVPFLNSYALPALVVTACVLAAADLSRRFLGLGSGGDRVAQAAFGLVGVLLLWFIASNELYDFFYLLTAGEIEYSGSAPRLVAQTVLSAVWAAYALGVLVVGLRLGSSPLRWTGLGLFALTFGKVFFYDTAELDGLYRVAVFLALSLMMAAAAWGYQKLLLPLASTANQGGVS